MSFALTKLRLILQSLSQANIACAHNAMCFYHFEVSGFLVTRSNYQEGDFTVMCFVK